MFSFPSLTTRFSLPAWLKRRNTMDPNPWDILVRRTLNESTDTTLLLYLDAAKKRSDPNSLLDSLVVVWMWQLKQDSTPFHEVSVIETNDPSHGNKTRFFILERIYHRNGGIDRSDLTEVTPDNKAEAATKAEPCETLLPPLLPTPRLSVGDSTSLAVVQGSHKISESLEKQDYPALDRFLGEICVERYSTWQCVRQIHPRGLNFFNLVLLAHVVHMSAPNYTSLKDNCFWYLTTIFDAITAHFGVDPTSKDPQRENKYSFDSNKPGRWNGMLITTSNPVEISEIVSKYREQYALQMAKV